MKQSPAQVAISKNRLVAQEKFFQAMAMGFNIRQALEHAGRARTTYERWWRKDPDFCAKVSAYRAINKDPSFIGTQFIEFRKAFFDRDTPAHHALMIEAIESAEPESITLILAPPEAAKSSLLVDYTCFKLGPVDPNHRICVISEGQRLGRKLLGQVANRMTDRANFANYINAYGPFKVNPDDKKRSGTYDRDTRKPWNADYLTVLKAAHDEKEYSFEALGQGSTIYGGRFELMLFDDIQSQETLGQTEAILGWLRLTALTRLVKGAGKAIIVGTEIGHGSIYDKMRDEGMVDRVVKIPALIEPGSTTTARHVAPEDHFEIVGDDGVVRPALSPKRPGDKIRVKSDCPAASYWPEYWSLGDLAAKRKLVGEDVWEMAYMQRKGSQLLKPFPDEMIRPCLDERRVIGQANVGTEVVCALDPAYVKVAAFGTFAFAADAMYLIDMDGFVRLAGNEGVLNHIERISGLYRPSTWIIEITGEGGKSIYNDDRFKETAAAYGFSRYEQQTAGTKSQPVYGVLAMQASFRKREIVLPYGDALTRAKIDPLLEELREWRPDVPVARLPQDRLMSLWFAWRLWLRRRKTLESSTKDFATKGLPWSPTTGGIVIGARQGVSA